MHKIAETSYSCGSAANAGLESSIFFLKSLKQKNKFD